MRGSQEFRVWESRGLAWGFGSLHSLNWAVTLFHKGSFKKKSMKVWYSKAQSTPVKPPA